VKTYFLFIGVASFGLALWLLARRLRVFLGGASATAQVTGHEAREDDGAAYYLPTVVFMDDGGREHRFTSVAGRSTKLPVAGRPVRVRYLPDDPRLAYIDSFLHMWAAPLALAVLGGASVAAYLG
jgi:hypothetical protein